jgi:hypothetical protein
MTDYFYVSLQYSAIQKTVLRHDRLWSMAGVSQMLSQINEIDLPFVVDELGGETLVAGGGKFTARFADPASAAQARQEMIKIVSTRLPMLEFQISDTVVAGDLKQAKEKNLIVQLSNDKKRFRGYGITYNPMFQTCEECGEYPGTAARYFGDNKKTLCRICDMSVAQRLNPNKIRQESLANLTSIEKIYRQYLETVDPDQSIASVEIATDFKNLFPEPPEPPDPPDNSMRQRMAVWFSDANNMNVKVRIWLSQPDQEIPGIFHMLTAAYIDITAKTLSQIFTIDTWNRWESEKTHYLPFRLIIAGGDDLCIVMPEQYVLKFAKQLSRSFHEQVTSFEQGGWFSTRWLKDHASPEKNRPARDPGSFSFGGAFLITSLHTPFRSIHEQGEHLMGQAKKGTERLANSINWQLLNAGPETGTDSLLTYEKPIYIDDLPETGIPEKMKDRLTFDAYLKLKDRYSTGKSSLSNSQIKTIADILQQGGTPEDVEDRLLLAASAGLEKGLKYVLGDLSFRTGAEKNGQLIPARIATMLEILTIDERREK